MFIYFACFTVSLILTYIIRAVAVKKKLLAMPNERSSHTVPTPHGGGIAIAVVWFSGLFILKYQGSIDSKLFYALLCGVLVSAVSYLDDVYELSPKKRLMAQAVASICAIYFLGGIKFLNFSVFTVNNQIISAVFAFFMIMWFINLYNFLDGIDGHAGLEAIFLSVAGFLLFGGEHFIILGCAVAGFQFWNWHRAKIFMGDVGSTLLGFNIAVFSLYYQGTDTSILVWIVLFGAFWFDATLTLYRRYRNGEKLSQAHKKHAYQRITQAGWRHDQTVLAVLGINILLYVMVVTMKIEYAFVLSLVLLYAVMRFVDKKKSMY